MRPTFVPLKKHVADAAHGKSHSNGKRIRELWGELGPRSKEEIRQKLNRESSTLKSATPFTQTQAHVKFSRGVSVPLSYWDSGTTTTSPEWKDFFSEKYLQNGFPTAPLFSCPFCFQKETLRYAAKMGKSMAQESLLAYQANMLNARARQYTPSEMQRHLAHIHPVDGWDPSQLQLYNKHVLSTMQERVNLTTDGAPPLSLIVLLDVANLELGSVKTFVDLLKDKDAVDIFTQHPIAVCAVQELLIPHTSIVLHVAFQLSQLNPFSDFYNLYSVTRAEAGDILSTWAVGSLYQRLSESLPPIVLLTKDSQQKQCMSEIFGGGSAFTGSRGTLRTTRQILVPSIVHALKEALESSCYPPY
ncbi:hypothetical protein AGDE_13696 [Angomonas deanei]|uniref:Uncharacterized protein n=1 Tax=Angomonas deanei TaxID=59799 RepID=A0A7G2C0J8_9TRYP|nr:hypothetical protein AGDE_13696 [Angomonas deanei]CAD2213260.1 hypothetical protein, conserved [Angomonas deanei]|eukprot:EPY21863.1 hypothetical protein AGDE_13696 [Angomonas deanei]